MDHIHTNTNTGKFAKNDMNINMRDMNDTTVKNNDDTVITIVDNKNIKNKHKSKHSKSVRSRKTSKVHKQPIEFNITDTDDTDDSFKNTISGHASTNNFRRNIIKNIIQPDYLATLKDTVLWRYRWRKIGIIFAILAKILTLAAMVLAAAEVLVTENNKNFAFSSAVVSGCVLLFQQYSEDSMKESSRRTDDCNEVLAKLKIDCIPDIADDNIDIEFGNNDK